MPDDYLGSRAETMQETCLRLMGKKLLVSLAMEEKFASGGLQTIDEGDDILMAMARELVSEKGIGERADAVWRQLVEKQAEVFGARATAAPAVGDEPGPSEPEEISRMGTFHSRFTRGWEAISPTAMRDAMEFAALWAPRSWEGLRQLAGVLPGST